MFFIYSDEICTCSLVSGCSFDVTCLDVASFGDQSVSSGMIVASTLALGGTIERSRVTSEHKKGDLGVQALISVDLESISGAHFGVFY